MIFSSIPFLFGFLPIVMLAFHLASVLGPRATNVVLVIASLGFYAYWRLDFLPLLLISIAFNFAVGIAITALRDRPRLQTAVLAGGVVADLLALVYYKYAVWLAGEFGFASIAGTPLDDIVLPLGISFFTFTQIAYLIDAGQGVAATRDALGYALFVTFFPHLIAGPILHNREMMPQFGNPATARFQASNLAVGATIFCIGLAKKVLLADPLAADVAAGFAGVGIAGAHTVGAWQAWHAVIGYSLQLYFDFSGYSDMAIGLARMFNIRFPLNFNSPMKATSIIDFWQRWHMTLTRFITQYIYNPTSIAVVRRLPAGNPGTRSVAGFVGVIAAPTMLAMGLAGIWHGAGLQYLVFGLLHGGYIVINHAARAVVPKPRKGVVRRWAVRVPLHAGKVLLVYMCTLVAWVFFRSQSSAAALDMLAGMAGMHGPGEWPGKTAALKTALLLAFVWTLPNTQQIMARYDPALGRPPVPPRLLAWKPNAAWAIAFGLVAGLSLLALGNATEFLYFQF